MPLLYLVDATSNIYRGHWTTGHLQTSSGLSIGAVYGFANMLLKLLREEKPTHIALVFDTSRETFRKEIYPEYKENRTATDPEMKRQIPLIYEMIELFAVPTLKVDGWEADDVIATLVKAATAADWQVVIVSGDKDLMQLLGPGVRMVDPIRGRSVQPDEVEGLVGVPPEKIVEVQALTGDSIDNVPGVKGIGAKWAARLVREYGDVEGVLAHAGDAAELRDENGRRAGKRVRVALEQGAEAARLSRQLVDLRTDAPVKFEPDALHYDHGYESRVREFFTRLEMDNVVRTLDESAPQQAMDRSAYSLVTDASALDAVVRRARDVGEVCVEVVADSPDVASANIIGFALATAPGEACYVPCGHRGLQQVAQLPVSAVLELLGPLLADPAVAKHGPSLKPTLSLLLREGQELRGAGGDVELAGALLEPTRGALPDLARRLLGHTLSREEEVRGKGKRAVSLDELSPGDYLGYACERVDVALRLWAELEPGLDRQALTGLYRDLELPLARALAAIELRGILVDTGTLRELGSEFQARINTLQELCWELGGEQFNPGSPKQLRRILFDQLGLKPARKTKTGFSTDQATLEELDHPITNAILELRKLTKLKNTYIDVLPRLVNERTGRVHTTFNQTGAATGRLSSDNPNLQNIPVREPEGRRIRAAFRAAEGHRLLSADYSQIELRLLAHLSGDEGLKRAFAAGVDIHQATAAEVMGIDPGAVTRQQRAAAKAVNFGIMYGISSYGLARQLGIARPEAQAYIDRYKARYVGVQRWIDETLEQTRETGEVRTLLGRRRRISNIRARQRMQREGAERQAINTPIQGTAADVMKAAIVRLEETLARQLPSAKILLTVHDELVLEVPEADVDAAAALARTEMEAVMEIDPPLVVDTGSGESWLDAH